jgi:hypothetical protein
MHTDERADDAGEGQHHGEDEEDPPLGERKFF